MQNFADQLSSNPQAKQLLENQKAIRQMLANPETRKVLQSLQKRTWAACRPRRSPPCRGMPLP